MELCPGTDIRSDSEPIILVGNMRRHHTLVVALCLLALTLAAVPVTAAAPKYVGLQYDQIGRMVIAPATAPPPGTFAEAYQKILADAPAADTSSTPAPRRGGLFGGLLSGISGA